MFRSIPVSTLFPLNKTQCKMFTDNSWDLDPPNTFSSKKIKIFLQELVEYYQKTTLEYSFPELRTTLVLAYKDAVRQMSSAKGTIFFIWKVLVI